MSDGILSQEEIDALLRTPGEGGSSEAGGVDLDAIAELLRISVEAGAEGLGALLNAEASAELAGVTNGPLIELIGRGAGRKVAVEAAGRGHVAASVLYVFSEEAAAGLGESMLGGSPTGAELNESNWGGFREAADELGAQLSSAMSTVLEARIDVDVQEPVRVDPKGPWVDALPIGPGEDVACCSFRVTIGELAFDLETYVSLEAASRLLGALAAQLSEDGEEGAEDEGSIEGGAAPKEDEPPAAAKEARGPSRRDPANVSGFEFSDFGRKPVKGGPANLDFLLDVPLQVTVELGRTRMQIRDILDLGKGSVIELDKLAGEPVEIYVNGRLIARGEVVTIDENFGVKITDIVSRRERVTNLQ